jgi:hypothetical protein
MIVFFNNFYVNKLSFLKSLKVVKLVLILKLKFKEKFKKNWEKPFRRIQ